MAMLKFDVPHGLGKEEARMRVNRLLDYWARKYGLRAEWQGDSAKLNGKAMGITINAQLQIDDQKVGGEATDPGFLFREKARKYLTEKFESYLDPKTPRDKLPEGD